MLARGLNRMAGNVSDSPRVQIRIVSLSDPRVAPRVGTIATHQIDHARFTAGAVEPRVDLV